MYGAGMAQVAIAVDGGVFAVVLECGCVMLAAERYQHTTLAYGNRENELFLCSTFQE